MTASLDSLTRERTFGSGAFAPRDIALVRGEGSFVLDSRGKRYLDATAGYGTLPLGHCHPEISAAIREQSERMVACPGIFANDVRGSYLEQLSSALPDHFERLFLTNSGTESIEAALKIARLVTGRAGVVACVRGFHGRTLGALSASWEPKYRDPFQPLLAGFRHVALDDEAALEQALDDGVGALLLEVVQGEGGVRPASTSFLLAAQRLCKERGALLIIDEVQTGFGRTGRLFAIEHAGIQPDLLCLAKGIASGVPLGAVALASHLGPIPAGSHGTTFGGGPLACAAAAATLRVIRRDRIADRAARLGEQALADLRQLESPLVREVRGVGLMLALELKCRALPHLKALQNRGVLALPAGSNVIRLLPPLNLSDREWWLILNRLREVLCAVRAAGDTAGNSA